MATVLLTAGVSALGIANPVLGAAALAGAGLVGGVVDQQLLRALGPAQKVEGPRLGDTPQPTAQYGVPIARLGGLARVTCPLIWIADQGGPGGLREQRRQQTTDGVKRIWYEYYGTWGVLLGRGPIAGIRRLWLNGQLVYDADAHATPETLEANAALAAKLTLHRGTETQARDPLIEQFQGTDATPAYRGWAYLVFDDLPLSDTYGNRIPEVQAEVAFEGAGGLAAGTDTIATGPSPLHGLVWRILAETGIDPALVDLTQLSDKVRGYATASVTAARELIEPLQLAYGWDWVEADGRLVAMKHPAPLRRPEHRTNTLISEHGLIVNAYHEEEGREGYFHSASGTSEGQMLAIAAFLHAEARLLASDPASAAAYRAAADKLAAALEPTLYRRSIPADSNVLFVPHWLFAAKRAIQLRSTRLTQRADFVPGGADAALSATGVAWGALDGDPALAFSGGFIGTARLDPWDYSADSLFTIELKLIADTSSGGEDRTLLQRLNAAGETQWRLYRIGSDLGFEMRVDGTLRGPANNAPADLTTPRWLSVVVGADSNPRVSFYLDGAATTGGGFLTDTGGLDATPGIYSVGLAAGDRAGTPAFLGTVSEIRLWAGARDSALMGDATPDPLGEADLRRLWRLDEGAGETAADAVPLGLIATLPPGPGAYGERVSQVFQAYAADGSRLLWENPYSVVVGTPETLVSWQAMADEAGTEVTIAGSTAKAAVIVSALDVGPWLEAGQPYEAWPVWRALEPGELDCAADTLYWALKAYERLFAAGGEAKWNDALAATKASIVETFKVDDGREIFTPQPVADAFSLPGTFEASQRPGVGAANWSRDPATGTIAGTLPAGAEEVQIGRGLAVVLGSPADTLLVEAGADLATDQVFVYLDTAASYSPATRYYAQLDLAGTGAEVESVAIPLSKFYLKDNGAAPGGGGLDGTLAGSAGWSTFSLGSEGGYKPGVDTFGPTGAVDFPSTAWSTAALSVEAFVDADPAALGGSPDVTIAEKALDADGTLHWSLYVSNGRLFFSVRSGPGAQRQTLGDPGQLPRAAWVAATLEAGTISLYVNGALVAAGAFAIGIVAGDGAIRLGQPIGSDSIAVAARVLVADVRLWSVARTSEALADPSGEAGLLHWWPCNEGTGSVVNDGLSAAGGGTLAADGVFPQTIQVAGFQDLETDGHTLTIRRLRPNPPTPLPYTPWATPFTVNTRGGQVISWRGLPGSGYQAPELWRLVGGAEGPPGAETQCRFLKDAQDAYQSDIGVRGPFAHVYVWDRADKAELGDPPANTWIYTWHDPNSKWGGYQYRPLEATARFIKESAGDAAYDAARALGDQVVEDFFLWLDGAWPITGNPVQGPPTEFPGPLPGGGGAPTIDYDEPHFAALILRAGIWARLRGYTPALNAAAVSQVQKAWAYLESLYVSTGTMAGTWSPDPAGETWYGFWHAEIVDALATLLEPGQGGGDVRVEAGIDAEAVKARLAGAAAWVAANTRSIKEIGLDALGAYEASGEPPPPYTYTRQQESEFPRETAVTTLDPELAEADNRSYARRLTTSARAVAEHRLPLVMTTGERERLARRLLYAAWARRHRYATSLARDHLGLTPGDIVELPVHGTTRRVQIERLDYDPAGLLRLEGFLDDPEVWRDTAVGTAAAPPRAQLVTSPVDTTLDLLDLPILDETDGDGPAVTAALAAGDAARWRGASLHRSLDGGATYSQVGAAAVPAAAGSVTGTLPAGPLWRFDRGTAVTVTLVAGSLESRSEAQLVADPLANLCVIGAGETWEVLQFATASLVAPKTYQLSTLLRGLRGTEEAVARHGPGEGFWLADFALLRVPLTTAQLGLALTYKAPTDGQSLAEAAAVVHANSGRALMPRAPAHLAAHRDPNSGDWSVQWTRRTRLGGGFGLASPAPLGEESEAYDAEVLAGPGGAVRRTIAGLTSPAFVYTAAQQSADFGSLQTVLTLRVAQRSAVVGRGFAKEETFT